LSNTESLRLSARLRTLNVINLFFLNATVGLIILFLTQSENDLTVIFSRSENLYLVELVFVIFALAELTCLIGWPYIFKYRQKSLKLLLLGETMRLFLAASIVCYGLVLGLLGSHALIKIILLFTAMGIFILLFAERRRIFHRNKPVVEDPRSE